ncbi:MAG: AHH domain-containing protein [Gemmatimonadaceae bacterium]|jgi:hypothetical protein|nr:AHH domain-containing protein [Gemmatimonadaceae bacterium]
MTQLGELVNVAMPAGLNASAKCPFNASPPTDEVSEEDENLAKDDVNRQQENNGGVLGANLELGGQTGWGSPGTWNMKSPPSKRIKRQPRKESAGNAALQVSMPDLKKAGHTRMYDWKVAAHHLIPGKASLKPSTLYKKFMVKGAKLSVAGKKFTLRTHIGYNVNGNHNGVWLPGNYAIRTASVGKSWSAASATWQWDYADQVIDKARGQFHDAHTHYNKNARAALDAVGLALINHIEAGTCTHCKGRKSGKLEPPYVLKKRLYAVSGFLRAAVRSRPPKWRYPWFTSDRFRTLMQQKSSS